MLRCLHSRRFRVRAHCAVAQSPVLPVQVPPGGSRPSDKPAHASTKSDAECLMIPLSPSASPRTRRAGTRKTIVFTSSSPNLIDRSIAASASGSRLIPWPRCLAMATRSCARSSRGSKPPWWRACQRQPDRSGLLQVLKCLGGPVAVGREERRSRGMSHRRAA